MNNKTIHKIQNLPIFPVWNINKPRCWTDPRVAWSWVFSLVVEKQYHRDPDAPAVDSHCRGQGHGGPSHYGPTVDGQNPETAKDDDYPIFW